MNRTNHAVASGAAMLAVAIAVGVLPRPSGASCLSPPGDVTGDAIVNVLDLQCLIMTSLYEFDPNSIPVPTCLAVAPELADLNCDFGVDLSDVLLGIHYVVGSDIAAVLDADSDQCPDTCEVVAGADGIVGSFAGEAASASFRLFPGGSASRVSGFAKSDSFSLTTDFADLWVAPTEGD